jgi:hypothetical protein
MIYATMLAITDIVKDVKESCIALPSFPLQDWREQRGYITPYVFSCQSTVLRNTEEYARDA